MPAEPTNKTAKTPYSRNPWWRALQYMGFSGRSLAMLVVTLVVVPWIVVSLLRGGAGDDAAQAEGTVRTYEVLAFLAAYAGLYLIAVAVSYFRISLERGHSMVAALAKSETRRELRAAGAPGAPEPKEEEEPREEPGDGGGPPEAAPPEETVAFQNHRLERARAELWGFAERASQYANPDAPPLPDFADVRRSRFTEIQRDVSRWMGQALHPKRRKVWNAECRKLDKERERGGFFPKEHPDYRWMLGCLESYLIKLAHGGITHSDVRPAWKGGWPEEEKPAEPAAEDDRVGAVGVTGHGEKIIVHDENDGEIVVPHAGARYPEAFTVVRDGRGQPHWEIPTAEDPVRVPATGDYGEAFVRAHVAYWIGKLRECQKVWATLDVRAKKIGQLLGRIFGETSQQRDDFRRAPDNNEKPMFPAKVERSDYGHLNDAQFRAELYILALQRIRSDLGANQIHPHFKPWNTMNPDVNP